MKPIALDAMGGDHAPKAIVEGALVAQKQGIPVVLVGPTEVLQQELEAQGGHLPVVEAPEHITMRDHATDVRKKRRASINICMELLRQGEVSAVVAMGHTGATLASALFNLGRVPGVDRPTLLIELPSERGRTYLADGGANVDCKPEWLVQFAVMATAYAKAQGVENPSVGLLSIGEEEEKGNDLILRTFPLLKSAAGLNFYGNVEGRDIFRGTTDIVVTDGYTGNVVLKLSEGEARVLFGWIRQALAEGPWPTRLGAWLVRPALQRLRARMDPAEYGAMPLLGVEGAVFIGHGSADGRAVLSALRKARASVQAGLVERVREGIARLEGVR
ncbi:MAG: phosphate acyltransferase PlsX [Meiothermus sp.]|uniref:phosphate acyltransferase PlsX n=1 Tax=Meiothermus sp. TaxID=1955249 RepID=UPI0025E13155|nr:phosphate acyltransferase PlsX [Meiothermus sp.]MCS7057622.1 phosphate acyltransferase PlsX [Meiothermus sp.]MCS7193974.1 phosphate acyltransferase PlsX [Meiothermus sp.]MCX7741031.1 phosphate acyltransferase PlsX [Meiothermus sp.]MDW8090740.1 phosphate acyltransferase PlsX [Meiothermus sp.]MDW8480834.1 phosphate acyltransferase PlsX [Meiothermus sp.]